ncbi:MAG: hypothetical protein RBS43_00145 [Candidatus Cloacimonas sp.]|jgi:hypothetical protein|nr:hypothetical protein [Candidatus Cloacimonas sp.]
MRNILIIIGMISLLVSLKALQVIDPQGKEREFTYASLTKADMQTFTTTRNKNGLDITETWQGIALLPWLSQNGFPDWQSLNSSSYDGYEVRLQRVDLDTMPAFIAVMLEGKLLPDSDLRLIYPETRDNLWLRGVKSISLEAFTGIPYPRQIFVWETESSNFTWDKGSIGLTELMSQAFHQNKGTVVFMDAERHAIALDYPAQLENAKLDKDKAGKLWLSNIKLLGKMNLGEIVYLQCGPYAYLKKAQLQNLTSLGKVLKWDWQRLSPYTITGTKTKLDMDIFTEKQLSPAWIELR